MKKTNYCFSATRMSALCLTFLAASGLSAQKPDGKPSNTPEAQRFLSVSRYNPDARKADQTLKRYPLLEKIKTDAPASSKQGIVNVANLSNPTVSKTAVQATPTVKAKAWSSAARTADGRELWGNVTYSNTWSTNDLRGFYSFNASSPIAMQMLGEKGNYYMEANGGAVFQDGTLYVTRWYKGGPYYFIYLNTFNPETMEQTGSTELEETTFIATETATNSSTGVTYGQFFNSEASGYVFGTVDYATMTRRDFGTSDKAYVALGVTKDNVLYGVAEDGNLYKISTTDGTETLIGNTGVVVSDANGGRYGQSGEIDQKTGVFYWAAKDAFKQSALYTVDLTTGAATKVADFPGQETIYGLTIPAPEAEDGAPEAITDLEVLFDNGSTTGYVGFTAPTKTMDGTALTGTLNYTIVAGTDTLKTGTVAPGGTVEAEVTVPEGLTTFNVTTSNEVGPSPVAKSKVYVGFDEPKPVQDLKLGIDPETGVATLTWAAATEGLHGGYLGDVTYNITRYPDSTVVATNHVGTTFTETLPADKPMQPYFYGVKAVNTKIQSTESTSNKGMFGAAMVPPYTEAFDSEKSFSLYTIIDNNNDGKSWEFYEKGDEKSASYVYSRVNDGDDWLITPAIQFNGGKLYSVSFEACSYGYRYNERVEVKWGNSPTVEGMTHTLLDSTDIISPTFNKYTREIASEKDQKVYIGFHAVSPKDEFRLYLRNVSVYEGLSLSLPDSVKALTVKADPTGELKASGSFTTPSLTLAGDSLTTGLSRVDVVRGDGKQVATFEAPKMDSTLTFTDDEALQGFNTYNVNVWSTEGEGRSVSAKVYVGIDTPKNPATPKLTDQTTSVRMDWKATGTVGANGGVVKPEEAWYEIFSVGQNSEGTYAQQLAKVEKGTSYDIPYKTNEGDQQAVVFGLAAATSAGMSGVTTSEPIIVGKPYALPVTENVAGSKVSIFWWGNTTGNSGFGLTNEMASDNDGGSFKLNIAAPRETAWLNTGKIFLNGAANPQVRFSHYADPLSDIRLVVEVQKPDGTVDSLSTFDYGQLTENDANEWRKASVSLKDYASLPYVMVRFRADIGGKAYNLYLDDINVSNVFANDLQTSIKAPAQLRKGNKGKVTVSVKNNGENAARNYTVRLLADGQEVAAQQATETLEAMKSTTFSFDYEPSLFNTTSKATLTAVADIANEGNADDNTASAEVELVDPSQAKPAAVSAETAETGGVTINWTAPATASMEVTDDMESYTSWNVDDFGDWTSLYEGDKGGAGALYSSKAYPHQGEKFAFVAFDPNSWTPEVTAQNPSLVPHSGEKYLAAFYNYTEKDGATTFYDSNDWLISPALSGEAQTVSFWVNNVSNSGTDFPEEFEVLYSKGGMETTSFQPVGEPMVVSGGQWQKVEFALPEGATHFAIHHFTNGEQSFVFMVDDVKYVSGNGSLKGYNVYCDGKLIGTAEATAVSFNDANSTDGQHTYAVTAVYAEGESMPATAQITLEGISQIESGAAQSATVYSIDGKRAGKHLQRGVYIENGKKVVVK